MKKVRYEEPVKVYWEVLRYCEMPESMMLSSMIIDGNQVANIEVPKNVIRVATKALEQFKQPKEEEVLELDNYAVSVWTKITQNFWEMNDRANELMKKRFFGKKKLEYLVG